MTTLTFDSVKIFHELDFLREDSELIRKVRACIDAQRKTGAHMLESYFQLNPNAAYEVSEEALWAIMRSGELISDIRTDRSISNCIAFNSKNLEGSVLNDELLSMRRETDRILSGRIKKLFVDGQRLSVEDSGHFWYPPGGYMGWHTNVRTPGWRMYINYAEEPGKSFFRYRDPETGQIVTSWDEEWNFRLFRIDRGKPFWHAVYSETNRFSLGYKIAMIPRRSLTDRITNKFYQLLKV